MVHSPQDKLSSSIADATAGVKKARSAGPVTVADARLGPARAYFCEAFPRYLDELAVFKGAPIHIERLVRIVGDPVEFWLTHETTRPLAFLVGGEFAGFALVGIKPFLFRGAGTDFKMAEFFVEPPHRRRGVGRSAAVLAFTRFQPGIWEVIQLPKNIAAVCFWRSVIGAFTGNRFTEDRIGGAIRQRFHNPPLLQPARRAGS